MTTATTAEARAASGAVPIETALDSRLVETHTAHVLMLGNRVYKWKKPVDLGFVDFRTLESRRLACEAELRLNRRLSPDVYLEIDVLTDAAGVPVEHVVVMRRLPDAVRLSALIAAGADIRQQVRRLARLIADFHSRCDRVPDAGSVAGADRLRQLWDVGLKALAAAAPAVLDPIDVDEAHRHVASFLDGRAALLDDRIARGFVRDGHGDLLADDIFCLEDGPRILDCLDFDETLRQGDVLGDVATLAMDLERIGAADAARQFVADYVEFSGEQHPDTLEHLYVAYRAQVRAKVALLRAEQTKDATVRDAQRQLARDLVALMLTHLRRTRVQLILVGGLPGSGKSAVADGLSQRIGCLVHSSDLVRRELRLTEAERYSAPRVTQVYDLLLDRAQAGLERGWSVVIDATWTDAARRSAARDLAQRTWSELLELECRAPRHVAEARLKSRAIGHVSDADVNVRRSLERTGDPWARALGIDTAGAVDSAVQAAVTFVADPRAHVRSEGRPPASLPRPSRM